MQISFTARGSSATLTIAQQQFRVVSKREALEKLQTLGAKTLRSERACRTLNAILRSKLPDFSPSTL